MKWKLLFVVVIICIFNISSPVEAQQSVARQWNEVLLDAIRADFARPTIHARNLFHTSIAMYDAWAAYDDVAATYLLGKTVNGFSCPFGGVDKPANVKAAREEAISYAVYRLLTHRFSPSPGAIKSQARFDSLFVVLGYDAAFISQDYSTGSPASLGNYIAQRLIDFGLQDGSNEQNSYKNRYYKPFNPPLIPTLPGNPTIVDPNRWQPLLLNVFIDQGGHVISGDSVEFLSPEWGEVSAFALSKSDLTIYDREGYNYWVYHDQGGPPLIDTMNVGGLSEEYKWGYALVAIWASHLDPTDGVVWDISPAAMGNIQQLPQTIEQYRDFYNLLDGGDPGRGHSMNPYTGLSYEPQMVPRGDYTRALAEFWADGPKSETPPGHWFAIFNYVCDHPSFEKRFRGHGPILDELEWYVKAYFALGGAVHDAAVAAWGIKGWYDSIRPISAIRAMADRGQSSDPGLPRYHPAGIPLIKGFIEMVQKGDSIAGFFEENIGKIKLYTWRGHTYISDPKTDVAGVGWILAENWWPYQRPTFVTPPFAGYVSGHSTFSRAAAAVLTLLTGDEYFPGGMGEFHCKKNEFLIHEDGPSVDLTLQWATYRDASDQCSLSRIWGGIHPPGDDMPGRLIGEKVGINAFHHAERYFSGQITGVKQTPSSETAPVAKIYPNPINRGGLLNLELNLPPSDVVVKLYNILGQVVHTQTVNRITQNQQAITMKTNEMVSGVYLLRITGNNWQSTHRVVIIK
ncbi:T9SS type A sorting domain-containing protein [candidate division KSB1 bacterium]|nr:T9SS type A sorting domain-containing protein [candidate division KSB1 bacterium]